MSKQEVLSPWTPINLKKENNNISIKLWGRKYSCGEKSFIESIISQEEELLNAPIRFVGTENGKEIVWGNFKNMVMTGSDESEVTVCSTAESDAFILNTCLKTEFDGCVDMSFSIMPIGRNPKQNLGFAADKEPHFNLTRLWLEIPLKSSVAKYYHIHPRADIITEDGVREEEVFTQAGTLTKEFAIPFREQIYLSNDKIGFAFFGESDQGIQTESENRVIECITEGDTTVLRIRLFDSEPSQWKKKGTDNGQDLYPITFRFGWIATPIKEFPQNPYDEKNIHLITRDDYAEYLFSKCDDSNEILIDKIARLGVNTLYIHEAWNDIQNSPFLTEETEARLIKIVKEAHNRGMKVIPYFGYEISSLSPYWAEYGKKIMRIGHEENHSYTWIWYRKPAQRAMYLCYNSPWQDIFAEGIENLLDKYDFDGIYIDGTMFPSFCMNEEHGCGYRDENGKLHATYPIWAIRKMMKRLYKKIEGRGGIINNHGGAAFNMSALSFCHSIWEGEVIQSKFMHGEINQLPEEHFRSVFTGRNYGVPINMLCYSNPPKWSFSQGVAVSVPFGILPKPCKVEELEYMSKIWSYIDDFPVKDAQWHPYYDGNVFAKSSSDDVKVSYYQTESEKLLFCANVKNEPLDVTIEIADKNMNFVSSFSDSSIDYKDGIIKTKFNGFGFALIRLK